ncbi:MAG: tRNA (adenosine(37)-N6)-threonylcarbamoyltransferase complex transferase subunit TsaD [Peptococcaceae bacterium]|nr:tRNA (adenosine(37)-N6)-threonylcarbamoyltransferase complex transferase subunit TsaD [Peptococcaceae bacterium]
MVKILAIESSCDETAAAVVEDGRQVLSNIIATQIPTHKLYGGVVPEIASREHLEAIVAVVDQAMEASGCAFADIDAIAVTKGPGLVGSLLVGVSYGKALAMALDKPLIGVHHLEGHIMANFLEHSDLSFPFLALVVSGSHSGLIWVEDFGKYRPLGQSRDDAAGEAFDKIARALGLPYPGGPAIQKAALEGDPHKYDFPRAWLESGSYDFSFSGLKSSVLNFLNQCRMKNEPISVPDIAASVQEAIVEVLAEKAIKGAVTEHTDTIVLAGGVAANKQLRERLQSNKQGIKIIWPSLVFCTDNAAMIGAAAFGKYQKGEFSDLSLNATASLPIFENSQQD